MLRHFATLLLLLTIIGVSTQAIASNEDTTKPSFPKLIRQLDANEFGERQSAFEQLRDGGTDAIPALQRAATNGSREASGRAIEILKQHFESESDELKSAAKKALEVIAESKNDTASKAADAVLNPPVEDTPAGGNAGNRLGGIRLGNAQIQLQFNVQNGNGKRITVKNVNGVKEIDAQENGQKVKIQDDPNNGIKMQITKKKDGKETTEKFEAKNAAELKKNHPEAHKIYEKYNAGNAAAPKIKIGPNGQIQIQGGGAGGIQIQGNGIQLNGGQILQNLQLPGQPLKPNQDFQKLKQEHMKKHLEHLKKMREQMQKRHQEALQRLEDQIEDLEEQADDVAEEAADEGDE